MDIRQFLDIDLNPFSIITPRSNPALHGAVNALAVKAGMETPHLVLLKPELLSSSHPNAMLKSAPAAAFTLEGKQYVMFNDKMLHIFGMPNIKAPVTEELKAVVAHELCHLKHKDGVGLGINVIAKHTPYACMIAGLGVAAYLVHQSQKHPQKPVADGGNATTPAMDIQSPTLKMAKNVGQCLLGAMAGLGVGVGIATLLRHRVEYRCDAFSKLLMGSGEPLARALEKFEAYCNTVIEKSIAARGLTAAQGNRLKVYCDIIDRLTHPSTEMRAAALRSM